jgi:hypothetical protein
MTRPLRCFQPSVNDLDKKTLLSAGQVGHLMGGPLRAVELIETKYDYYLRVLNDTGRNLEHGAVKWELVSNGGHILHTGQIAGVFKNGESKLLVAGPSKNSLGDTFTLKFDHHVFRNIAASSSSTGEPAFIPTYILRR